MHDLVMVFMYLELMCDKQDCFVLQSFDETLCKDMSAHVYIYSRQWVIH
jgi:hypothetical protein